MVVRRTPLLGEHGISWGNMGVKGYVTQVMPQWNQKRRVVRRLHVSGEMRTEKSLRFVVCSWRGTVPRLGCEVGCQTACKPGSVRALRRGAAIPLGRASLRASRDQPGRRGGTAPASQSRVAPLLPPAAPIRSCSRWGLPCRPRCRGRGALLPHRFTLARGGREPDARAVCSLWHFPWGRPRRPLAGTVVPWSPDFPPPDCYTRQRPPGRLAPPRCAEWTRVSTE